MPIALTHAHLINGDGRSFDDATVVIAGGRIAKVATDAGSPSAEVTIDLEGRALMPGMIDLHVHMVGGDKAMGFGDEATTFKMSDSVIKATLDGVEAARKTLHAGITTVREIAARDYIDVYLKRAQATGQITGPRMLATGPGVFMTGGHGSFLQPGHEADGVDAMVRRV
ncbi:MAG TPA: amidohydrolase family protein, partial [Dehalococcoidia bacterium]|nr:amidohydrolase family protein [Dehalococcoidia bacterium]